MKWTKDQIEATLMILIKNLINQTTINGLLMHVPIVATKVKVVWLNVPINLVENGFVMIKEKMVLLPI